MIIVDRQFFSGLYLAKGEPDVIDGVKTMHVEPPIYTVDNYKGNKVFIVKAYRSKLELSDTVSHIDNDGKITVLPIESCDVSTFTTDDRLPQIYMAIATGDLSIFPRTTRELVQSDLARGVPIDEIIDNRGGIMGDFIGDTIEEAREFLPDLFEIIDANIALQETLNENDFPS